MKKILSIKSYKRIVNNWTTIIDEVFEFGDGISLVIQVVLMKIIKIAAVFAGSFLVALFILIIKGQNPEVALYDKTVEVLMDQESLASEQDVLDSFPALQDIKSNMTRVAQLDWIIQSKTQGPAPMVTEADSKQLIEYRQEIRQLRKLIRKELSLLMALAIYVAEEPLNYAK